MRWPGPPPGSRPSWAVRPRSSRTCPSGCLAPPPGNIEKINENYRYKLTIKCRADRRFRDLVRQTLGLYEQEKLPAKATVVVDMHSDGDI